MPGNGLFEQAESCKPYHCRKPRTHNQARMVIYNVEQVGLSPLSTFCNVDGVTGVSLIHITRELFFKGFGLNAWLPTLNCIFLNESLN